MNNTVVFLTALPLEYGAVVAYLPQRRKEIKSDNTIYEIGEYVTPKAAWQVVVGKLAAQGNYQAARETEWAIGHFAPTYMFFVGIAGGLKDVQLGDVVAASFVRGYEGGKTEDDKWKPRVSVEHPSHKLLQLAQNLASESQWLRKLFTPAQPAPKAWVCPIASGEKVGASQAFLAQLQETCSDAVAVEMEALGFLGTFRAKPQVQGIVIRGISDLVVDKSKTDAVGCQPIAARNAAAFAFAMLDELAPVTTTSVPVTASVTSSQPQPLFRIPLPRNEYFTGREDILTQIHETLPHRPVAVCGLGGLGKTQVAVEYAYQHQGEYTYVFWLAAHDNVTLQMGVEAIAKDLGLHQPLPPDEVRAWVKEKFSHTPNWLLVVDNADELVQIQQVFTELLPLPLTTGQVLLTTRQQAPPSPLTPLTLDTLTDDQGAELLLRRTRDLESKSSDVENARTLSHTLQGLPLALAQAAAYIYEMQCSYSHYLTLYEKDAARLLKERGNLVFDNDHPLPVATTWKISIDQIQGQQPRALELLYYCAFLAPTGIPEEILMKALTSRPHWSMKWLPFRLLAKVIGGVSQVAKIDFDILLKPILSYSLLTRDSDSQQVRIHSLVQTILRSELGEEKGRALVEQLVSVVKDLFPSFGFENWREEWAQAERLVPSALACAEGIQRYQIESEIAVLLLNQTGYYLQQRGDYATTLPLYERALEIGERVLGKDHPLTATSLNNLADLYRATGQYEQALPLSQRALEIWERVLGTDHPSTATSLNNLAALYDSTGQYEQALPLYERALEITERVLGKDHPSTATSLNNLAALYDSTGQYEQALPLYERALEIRERVLGKDHPDTAQSLNNLAVLYRATGQYEQALPLYQRALEIRERVLGTDHPDTAISLWWLAVFYGSQGEYEKALSFYERALTILKKTLGEQHPNTQTCTENYQGLLRKMASQGGAGKES
jgi:tetratricopeptide (TPR) repeat protein/nucleoside phosphorylase